MPYGQRVHHLPCTYLPSLIEHYNIASTSEYYLAQQTEKWQPEKQKHKGTGLPS
jgi:hypothetical protein